VLWEIRKEREAGRTDRMCATAGVSHFSQGPERPGVASVGGNEGDAKKEGECHVDPVELHELMTSQRGVGRDYQENEEKVQKKLHKEKGGNGEPHERKHAEAQTRRGMKYVDSEKRGGQKT